MTEVMRSAERFVSPNTGYVGDVFTYRVVVHHGAGEPVALVPSGGVYGAFEPRHVAKVTQVTGPGAVTEFTAQISVFETGMQIIPSQTVTISAGKEVVTLDIPALSLPIQTLLTSASPTPNPLKSPMTLSVSWGFYVGILMVMLLAVGAGFFAYRYMTKRFKKVLPTLPQDMDTRSAYEKALEAMDRLERDDLAKTGDFKQHYLRLSDSLKALFSDYYGAAVVEMTTDETLDFLSRKLVLEKLQVIRDILEVGDLVKFAKSIPELPVHYDLLVKARGVVAWFKPTPTPPERGFQ